MFKLINGILYCKSKPFLGKNSTLQTFFFFLQEFHATATKGHTGVAKTFSLLNANTFCNGMLKVVQNVFSTCNIFQQLKYIPKAPLGLLNPYLNSYNSLGRYHYKLRHELTLHTTANQ